MIPQEDWINICIDHDLIVRCPNCNRINVGQTSPKFFYCMDCCIEMKWEARRISFYEVNEAGDLLCIDDLFYEEEKLEEEIPPQAI